MEMGRCSVHPQLAVLAALILNSQCLLSRLATSKSHERFAGPLDPGCGQVSSSDSPLSREMDGHGVPVTRSHKSDRGRARQMPCKSVRIFRIFLCGSVKRYEVA